jgi:hypothetical protein
MLRAVVILLILAVSFDHIVLDGRYTVLAKKVAYLLLHRV